MSTCWRCSRRRAEAFTDEGSGAPGGLTPSQKATLERIAPLAEVLFLTIAADGELARSECRAIRTAIGTLTDDLLPAPSIEGLLAELEESLAQHGPGLPAGWRAGRQDQPPYQHALRLGGHR